MTLSDSFLLGGCQWIPPAWDRVAIRHPGQVPPAADASRDPGECDYIDLSLDSGYPPWAVVGQLPARGLPMNPSRLRQSRNSSSRPSPAYGGREPGSS